MLVECCICYEKTRDLGELDACLHRFCFECISRWAATENRCPMCKERFIVIKRKRLPGGKASTQAGGSGNNSYRPVGLKRTREQATETDAAHIPSDASDDDEDPDLGDGPRKRLKGTVIETRVVPDRTQTWQPAELLALNLEALRCQVCSRGDDDERLLLCDGCDRGFHTYCVHMDGIPQGEWYCPECEEHRAALSSGRGRRQRVARGRAGGGRRSAAAAASAAAGEGRGGSARGRRSGRRSRSRRAVAAASAAATADVISDSDSGVVIVADTATGGSDGAHDSGYETIGSDAADQEGPVLALHSDTVENEEEVAEVYEYDDDGSGEDDDDGNLDDGSDQDEDVDGEADDGTGAYATADVSRSAGSGGTARRRTRQSNRSRGRGRGRGRGRSRRRRASTANGRSSRRGPSRAALRERLGTAARTRARTAAQGLDSAAAAAEAAAAAGDLEEVPLAQRRTVARARLYADQLRVEMMRRNWTALRGAEAQEFGQSTLGTEYRRLQQEQGAAAAPAAGSSGASSSAAAAARERALQALRAQRTQEAAAAAARRRGGSGRRRTEPPDAGAGLPLFGLGAYEPAYAIASEDDELAGAWRTLSRLRGASGAVSGNGRGGSGSGTTGAAISGNGNVPARLGGPPLGPSPIELLRSAGPGALVGGFTRPQRPPVTILGQCGNSNGMAVVAGAAQVARSASLTPRLPLSALIPGLTRSPPRPPGLHGGVGPGEGLGGGHSSGRNCEVTSSGGGEGCGLSGRAVGGTASSRGIVIFSSDEPQDNREAGSRSLPQPLPLQSRHPPPPPPPPLPSQQQQHQQYSSHSMYPPVTLAAETSSAAVDVAAAFHTNDGDAHSDRSSPSRQPKLHPPPPAPQLLPPVRAPNVVLPSLAAQQPANKLLPPPSPPPLPTLPDEVPRKARLRYPCSASHQGPSPSAHGHDGFETGEVCLAVLDSNSPLQLPVRAGTPSGGAAAAGSRGSSDGSRDRAAAAMDVNPSGGDDGGPTRSYHHHKHRHRDKHRHGHRHTSSHRQHLHGQERRHRHKHHPHEKRNGDCDPRGADQYGEAHRYHRQNRSYDRRQRRRSASEEGEIDSDDAGAEAGPPASGAQVGRGPGTVVNSSEGAGPHESAARDSSRKAAKLAACEAVKALLTPLYSQRLLGKEAFKEAAKAATAALCTDMAAAGLGAEDLQKQAMGVGRGDSGGGAASGDWTVEELAAAALARTLQGMGLGHLMAVLSGPHVRTER